MCKSPQPGDALLFPCDAPKPQFTDVTEYEVVIDVNALNSPDIEADSLLALADGGALASNWDNVYVIDPQGMVSSEPLWSIPGRVWVQSLIRTSKDDEILILHDNGMLKRINLNGTEIDTYWLPCDGCQMNEGLLISDNELLYTDYPNEEIRIYFFDSGETELLLDRIDNPYSIDYIKNCEQELFVVVDKSHLTENILFYDRKKGTTSKIQTFYKGLNFRPLKAIIAPNHNILVSDQLNSRLDEFSQEGDKVKTLFYWIDLDFFYDRALDISYHPNFPEYIWTTSYDDILRTRIYQ